MEDFRVDVVVGKGPGATAIPLDVEPFTLVGATTRAGPADRADAGPVRLRRRTWTSTRRPSWTRCCTARRGSSGVPITDDGAAEIAGRSRGTPRIANRLLRRVRDYAEVRADGVVDADDGPGRAEGVRRRRARAGPAGPGGADARWSTRSAAVRSGCPRSPWRWGSSRTRSRRSASRSWCGPGCWPVRRGAGWPPRRPGGIWGVPRRMVPLVRMSLPVPDLFSVDAPISRDVNVICAAFGVPRCRD